MLVLGKVPVLDTSKIVAKSYPPEVKKREFTPENIPKPKRKLSWESKGTPPMPPPQGNKALLRDY